MRPLFSHITKIYPRAISRKMSTEASGRKVAGKLYQYESHSRWNRLHAVALAAGVTLEPVQGFSIGKAMNDPEFLAKFPGGTCPAFETLDGKVRLTEASAISDYIASSNPSSGLIPSDVGLAATVRMWMFIAESEIIAPLTTINRGHGGLYEYNKGMSDGILATVDRRLKNINNHVAKREFLVGDSLTLADITLASALGHGYAKFFDKAWRDKYPEAFKYFERITQNDRVKDAFQGLQLADVTPEPKQK